MLIGKKCEGESIIEDCSTFGKSRHKDDLTERRKAAKCEFTKSNKKEESTNDLSGDK